MEISNILEQPAFTPPQSPSASPPPIVENPIGNSQVATADAIAPIEGDKGTIFNGVA
mgnify:FL=1|tara:strand:+ start:1086 stop:1256 length:171 start_codon:yes stop_codon:yes gene_type:complete